MSRKKWIYFIIIVLGVLQLGGCSSKAKSESQIREDITREDRYFSDYGIKIKSSNISKRQTNPESKTDYVWISVVGDTSEFEYYAEYELMYILYNDGWLLEDCTIEDRHYEAKSLPGQDIADSIMQTEYSDFKFIASYVNSANKVSYEYISHEFISEYLTIEYSVHVSVIFSPSSGWHIGTFATSDGERIWNLEGKYIYHDSYINIEAEIQSYDAVERAIIISGSWNTANASVSTDGYVKCELLEWGDSYVLQDKYADGLVYGNTNTHVHISGETRDFWGGEVGIGVQVAVWDGQEWHKCWLTRVE